MAQPGQKFDATVVEQIRRECGATLTDEQIRVNLHQAMRELRGSVVDQACLPELTARLAMVRLRRLASEQAVRLQPAAP